MVEYLITLSALIVVILIIRRVFRKTIPPVVMYGLWLVVVLRLCLPFPIFTLAVLPPSSVENVQSSETQPPVTEVGDAEFSAPETQPLPVMPGISDIPDFPPVSTPATVTPIVPNPPVTGDMEPDTPSIPQTPITPPETDAPRVPDPSDVHEPVPAARIDWVRIAKIVWISGSAALAVWFAVTGLLYQRRLAKGRTLFKKLKHTRVYLTEDESAPCLSGLLPSIYIRPETPESGDTQAYIVLHEYMHLRHGDHVWSLVRILALIVHWWNPFVWAAALVSKQDAELACDYAVAAKLKSEDRFTYARILLDTVPQKHRYAVGLGSSPMKERILALTKKQKNRILCIVLAAVLAIGAVVGSFIALTEKPQQGDETAIDIPFTDEAAIAYALELAAYFRDPVSDVSELKEHENLWQFLVNSIYAMHENGTLTIYDITEKEWLPQYVIPQLYFLKSAEVLLGLTNGVPERIFALPDFGYDPDLDAFVYSPFSGPMYVTENMRAVQNEDGTFSVTVRISRIEESAAIAQNVYTFLPVEDSEWGTVYQLVSIENALDENTSVLGDYVKLTVAPSGGMEVENMPLTQYARLTAFPVGYNPTVYVYNDDMTFYMVYSTPGDIKHYMSVLRLPDGYENGYIVYAEGGAGSGELFLYVTAEKDGEDVLLAYFFLCDGSQPQPTEVILLTGEWKDRIVKDAFIEKPTDVQILNMWRSVEGQRNPYGLTYGVIPNSFNPIVGTFTSADYYADGGAKLNEVLNAYDESTHQMPVLAYVVREMEIPREELVAYLEASEIPYTEQILDDLLTADIGMLNRMFLNPIAEYHDGVIYTTAVFYEMTEAGEEIPLSLQIVRRMAQNAKAFGDQSTTPLPAEYAEMYHRILTKKISEMPESEVQAEFDMYTTEFTIYPRVMTLFVGTDRFNEWLESTPLLTVDENYSLIPRSIVTMVKDFGITKEEFELLSYIGYYGEIYDVEVMYEGTAQEIDNYFRSIPRWRELCAERGDLVFVKGVLLDAMPGYTNDVTLRDKYNSLPLTCWTFSDLAIDGIYTKDEMKTLLESAVLYDSIGLQMTNRYDVDAIFAEAERNPVSISGHWSISDDATREDILAYGAHCKEVIEKERTFYTPWYDLPRYEEKVVVSVDSVGPFVGYVEDAQTPWIELYTEKDGLYVGRIPYKIFDGWPATERDREGWTSGWQPEYVHFYLARFGSFVWAGVHLTDTVAGSGRKNVATSSDYGASWEMRPYYETDFGGNHVTGMGFASENVAFMSFDPQFEPIGTAAISRTIDGGKTWERMPIEVPEILSAYRLMPLVPRFDGLTGDYPILISVARDGQKYENTVYLRTQDGGMTWEWDIERALSTYRLPGEGTWEAHYTPAAMYDYDVGDMAAHSYYDPHVGYYVTELYATSDKSYIIVLGVQNDRQPYGTFTDFKTYRVVTKANYVDSVTELPTITKEIVYREGKPFTGTLSGIYQSKLYGEQGLMNRRVVIDGDTISVHVGLDATDAGGLYEGAYTHDKTTGAFTATVKLTGATDSLPETVSGKLYEYGGYVHFLCEESETYSLSADSLLPLTFRKEGAPLPDNSDMIGENQAGDWYSTYTNDHNVLQYVYRLTFDPESRGITFSSDYKNGAYGHVWSGTYTVDANYFVRATLREGTEEITMKFSFGYSQTAAPSGGWIKMLGITLYECSAEEYKDLIGTRLLFEEELSIIAMQVSIPLSDNGREYIACAAAYGDSFGGTAPYAGVIQAGPDGTMYYVMGVGDSYRSSGYFRTYKTYRATSQGGILTSVEETETFTKDAILKNGTPYKGSFSSEYTCYATKAQSDHYGTILRTYVLNLEENGKISLSSTEVGTGPAIRYEGTYTYDADTGLLAASLTGTYANEGETTVYPAADVRGKLYEYGGFVHFVCEESGIHILSPEDPLPLTFVKSADSDLRAQALTAHLIRSVMTENWLTFSPTVTKRNIFDFLITLPLYTDIPNHPYSSMITVVDRGTSYLSLADAQKIVSELFGLPDWTADSYPSDDAYDPAKKAYFVPDGIGLPSSAFDFENMTVSVTDEYVFVQCTVVNSSRYEYEEKNYGTFAFIYYRAPDGTLQLTEIRREQWRYTPAFAENSSIKYVKTAAYGENILYADLDIHAAQSGVGYVTFGVITGTPGEFSRYYTYRVTSADGYVISAEETETFTGVNVLKNGTPYKGSLDGEYRCETYNGDMLLYRYIKISGDTISVSVSRSGTDGGGTYTGTYGYDETTGAFHADVRANGTGTPHSVTGRLHEYGGFVHFLCRSSTIGTISPEDPLPLTFVKPAAPKYRSGSLHTVPVYGGEDVTLYIPSEWEWDGSGFDEIGVRGEPYPNMKRVRIYTANISLSGWEDGLRNPEGPSRDYIMDSPITGTTDYGCTYTGYFGDGYADGDEELTRRYLFYIDTGDDAYVLEIWQRLEYDGDSTAFLSEVVLPIVRSFCEADRATVSVSSLADLKTYADRGIISEQLYGFYHDLISGESDIPEYNTVKISRFRITFASPLTEHNTRFNFIVDQSGMDTLPTGQYAWTVKDIVEPIVPERETAPNAFWDTTESHNLWIFLNASHIWNTPTYGQGGTYPGMHNYICRAYGNRTGGIISWDDYKRIAAEEFGVTEFDSLNMYGMMQPDGTLVAGDIGGGWRGDCVDITETEDGTVVTVQFYADVNRLLNSHKVAYTFGTDGRWLGYDILEKSAYEPYGLYFAG